MMVLKGDLSVGIGNLRFSALQFLWQAWRVPIMPPYWMGSVCRVFDSSTKLVGGTLGPYTKSVEIGAGLIEHRL